MHVHTCARASMPPCARARSHVLEHGQMCMHTCAQANVCMHGHMRAYLRAHVCACRCIITREQMCLHAYICTVIHAYVCTCMQIHLHMCEQTCLYVQIHPCTLICTGARTALYVNAHTQGDATAQVRAVVHVHVCASPRTHTDAHTWPYMCTYTHVYTGVGMQIRLHVCEHNHTCAQVRATVHTRANLCAHRSAPATSVQRSRTLHSCTQPCLSAPTHVPHLQVLLHLAGEEEVQTHLLPGEQRPQCALTAPWGPPLPGLGGGLPGELQTREEGAGGCTKQSGC